MTKKQTVRTSRLRRVPKGYKPVTIYTDGSWKQKLNAGGYAALLTYGPHWKMIYSSESPTTISRMELSAVLNALKELTEPCCVTIVSDSTYTCNCINRWIKDWKRRNWITWKGSPVANLDLIRAIDDLMQVHKVIAIWVKSHTGKKDVDSIGNDLVDYYAQHSADTHHKTNKNSSSYANKKQN